jgi:arsenate reductase (thioredoxin)
MGNEVLTGSVRRRVLFVCIGNSCRSQFAEAIARHLAADVIEPSSAGLYALGRISEGTEAVGKEMGLSFDGQSSKPLRAADFDRADLIVNLSGIPARSAFVTEKPVVDWDVDDPYGEELAIYRRIASEIQQKVRQLAEEFRSQSAHSGSS